MLDNIQQLMDRQKNSKQLFGYKYHKQINCETTDLFLRIIFNTPSILISNRSHNI